MDQILALSAPRRRERPDGQRAASFAAARLVALKASLLAALALVVADARAGDATAGDLLITEAWARATPPGISVGAVYLTIANRGTAADRLLEVSSALAERSEIHQTTTRAGVMSMQAVSELACPPGATVKIGPGGVHIMLLGLKQPWSPGSRVPLTLRFQRAGSVQLSVPVQAQEE